MIELRWLKIYMGDLDGSRPSAIRIPETPFCLVLQFRESREDIHGKHCLSEWRDIPVAM